MQRTFKHSNGFTLKNKAWNSALVQFLLFNFSSQTAKLEKHWLKIKKIKTAHSHSDADTYRATKWWLFKAILRNYSLDFWSKSICFSKCILFLIIHWKNSIVSGSREGFSVSLLLWVGMFRSVALNIWNKAYLKAKFGIFNIVADFWVF